MKFFTYKIDGKNGIHARPAGALVNTAKGFSSNITIKNGNRDADAKRLFSVMSLGAKHGDELAFFINGRNARLFASQGQQRTVVLAWKLAEVELVREFPVGFLVLWSGAFS